MEDEFMTTARILGTRHVTAVSPRVASGWRTVR